MEKLRFINIKPESAGTVIEKSSRSILMRTLPEDDYLRNLPRIKVDDDVRIGDLGYSDELRGELQERGLSSMQIGAVNSTLSIVSNLTVGELLELTDEKVLMISDLRGNIRLRRLLMLRLLFGSEDEEPLASD